MRFRICAYIFMIALTFVSACSHPWNVAHAGLEIVNEAAVQTDAVLAEAQEPALNAAKLRTEEAYEGELIEFSNCRKVEPVAPDCLDPGTPEAYTKAHYDTDSGVVSWGKVADGVDIAKRTILTGEAVVEAWRDTKAQPAGWRSICDAIQTAADQTTDGLKALEVDIPTAWDQGRVLLAPLCNWIGDAVVAGSGDKGKLGEVL